MSAFYRHSNIQKASMHVTEKNSFLQKQCQYQSICQKLWEFIFFAWLQSFGFRRVIFCKITVGVYNLYPSANVTYNA